MNGWFLLGTAIILEVTGTTFMKLSEGFEKPVYAVIMFLFYALSFTCLTLSLKVIPIGTAYAVWAGTGTALVAVIGWLFFSENMNMVKVLFIIMIIFGVAGLNRVGGH